MEQPRWYIIPTDTRNEKWVLINVGILWRDIEPESFTSCYRRWGSRLLSSSTTKYNAASAPSVSLIITACVPAKITSFIHPQRVPTLLCVLPTPPCFLPRFISSPPFVMPYACVATYLVFIQYCMWNFTIILCTAVCRAK